MGRVKIQIGPARHKYIYHPVEKGMWYASGGGGHIKSVWMCERADDKRESEKKLILLEFADMVVAYDCRWSKENVAWCSRSLRRNTAVQLRLEM